MNTLWVKIALTKSGYKLFKGEPVVSCMFGDTMHTVIRHESPYNSDVILTQAYKHGSNGEPKGWFPSLNKARADVVSKVNEQITELELSLKVNKEAIETIDKLLEDEKGNT